MYKFYRNSGINLHVLNQFYKKIYFYNFKYNLASFRGQRVTNDEKMKTVQKRYIIHFYISKWQIKTVFDLFQT